MGDFGPAASRIPPTAAHVFVDDLGAPVLNDEDAHHLARALRLRDGEQVTVADGRGGWRLCVFRGARDLEPTGTIETVATPERRVVIGFALTKGDKPELTVQKLTELGVDRIVLIAAQHSVVHWGDGKAARNADRLRLVARAAAMQSRRAHLPLVDDVTTLQGFAATEPTLALAHADGAPLTDAITSIAIGPEGGWSPEELGVVASQVDLGPTTLRAETAALAAGVLLIALRDGRIRPAE